MRVMANRKPFFKLRNWVQLGFLAVWLNPLIALPQVCGVVYHCHACPASAFACPIGVLANFAAWHVFPLVAVGLLLAVALSVGSLICGWVCPFGLLQDLAAKLPTPKLRLPAWMGCGRFVVLGVMVLAVPYWLGKDSALFICRICPVGTLEASIPDALKTGVWPSTTRLVVLGLLLTTMVFVRRPWCRVLCPLGGLLALGNRFSLLRIRWNKSACNHCTRCAKACPTDVDPTTEPNSSRCVRCLDCTSEPCNALDASITPPH